MADAGSSGSTRWVALLRGVNVGGITVRSAPLAAMFRDLGYADVRTVLASGNVVFSAAGAAATLKTEIERALSETFGYEAWIVLLPQSDLDAIIAGYPFGERDGHHPYVVFGSDSSVLAEAARFAESLGDADERVAPGSGVLYWEAPAGSSTSTAFAKELAKKRYKATTTTRNLRTLRKLLP
ncbi:Uncharacterized conserved protein, DUF1697 family [Paramicrobacterium humi]|uniref:Uncharacterized conserved protein, DUF1697 family n=2 Tax=Paramicrobacterium humi TaxID=640635 RepID=A0A1H4J6W2_9MICO|nr:Uncharacterized conserved protein, DUF1697 family [Microbacterium humi]